MVLSAAYVLFGIVLLVVFLLLLLAQEPSLKIYVDKHGIGGVRSTLSSKLKVFTLNFNSEIILVDNEFKLRDLRSARIIKWIKEQDPDVIFICEGWNTKTSPSVVEDIGKAIDYDFHYILNLGLPGFGNDSSGILCRKSLQMDSIITGNLSGSSFSIGDRKNWIIPFGVITSFVGCRIHVFDPETQQNVSVFCYGTHLLGNSAIQITDLLQKIEIHIHSIEPESNYPNRLLMGDFNTSPDDPILMKEILPKNDWQDCWLISGDGSSGNTFCSDPNSNTYNPFTLGAGQFPIQNIPLPNTRFDYIFLKSNDLESLCTEKVFESALEGVWMSDHAAVLSTFQLKSKKNINHLIIDDALIQSLNPEEMIQINITGLKGFTISNNTKESSMHFQIIPKNKNNTVFPTNSVTIPPATVASFILYGQGLYRSKLQVNNQSFRIDLIQA